MRHRRGSMGERHSIKSRAFGFSLGGLRGAYGLDDGELGHRACNRLKAIPGTFHSANDYRPGQGRWASSLPRRG